MHVFRPIRESDLAELIHLAKATGGGLTTLPANEEFLKDRIYDAARAFSPRVSKPGAEYYLFGLEDTLTGEIVGVSGIAGRVGGFEPWYSYEIKKEAFSHAPLNIQREVSVLHLKKDHRGPSEVCSLFLRADRRRGGTGRLLSLARFLFIASFRSRFTSTVIAEMRGYTDSDGKAPFWEAVGRHFFEHDFYTADVMSGLGEKQFIADLMPRHPLYVPLLPAAARDCLGRVHRDTEAALALLRSEGFDAMGEIDIFDGGPLLRADAEKIRTIRQSRLVEYAGPPVGQDAPSEPFLIANGSLEFRAAAAPIEWRGENAVLFPADLARALEVEPGATVRICPLR